MRLGTAPLFMGPIKISTQNKASASKFRIDKLLLYECRRHDTPA